MQDTNAIRANQRSEVHPVQPLNFQGQKNREVIVGIDLERMHAARKTPKHELPRGLSLDEMREHILAVANKAK